MLQNAVKLDSEIIYDRDFDYDYFGFKVRLSCTESPPPTWSLLLKEKISRAGIPRALSGYLLKSY